MILHYHIQRNKVLISSVNVLEYSDQKSCLEILLKIIYVLVQLVYKLVKLISCKPNDLDAF